MAGVWTFLRAMYGLDAGRTCRVCSEPVRPTDAFGMSEGVCEFCRRGTARGRVSGE